MQVLKKIIMKEINETTYQELRCDVAPTVLLLPNQMLHPLEEQRPQEPKDPGALSHPVMPELAEATITEP